MNFKIRKALENHDEVCAHWFPKASLEEVEVCYKPKSFNQVSFSVMLSSYNGGHAKEDGIFIHCANSKFKDYLVLVPVDLEWRNFELAHKEHRYDWKEAIPEEYR